MQRVKLIDENNRLINEYIGFSYWHLIFGPFYLLFRGKFFLAMLELLAIYYFLPIPGMPIIIEVLNTIFKFDLSYLFTFLRFFRNGYFQYIGIAIFVIIHFISSFFIEPLILKGAIKKHMLLPFTEQDARILIAKKIVSPDIELASTYNYHKHIKKAPYLAGSNISSSRRIEKQKRINALNERFASSNMKREEYEAQLSLILEEFND